MQVTAYVYLFRYTWIDIPHIQKIFSSLYTLYIDFHKKNIMKICWQLYDDKRDNSLDTVSQKAMISSV